MTDQGRTYHFAPTDGEQWRSVVDAVAFVTGTDPLEMDPLYENADPEVIESLAGTDSTLSFSMEGVDVTVSGDGDVVVEDGRTPAAVEDRLDDSASVLLLAPDRCDAGHEACADLLFGGAHRGANALGVTFGTSPGDRVRAWTDADAGSPARTAMVDVDQPTRSATDARSRSDVSPDGGTTSRLMAVDRVTDASDLAAIGRTITERIEDWAERGADSTLCFHSLTSLLMHVDDADAFRFFHILTEQLESVGVPAHVHADPLALDETTIRTFQPLFDAVVEVDSDGDWFVKTDTGFDAA